MVADCRAGRIQAVVVYKLDRLGRKTSELLTLVDEWKRLDIEFVSVVDNIDTSTPNGKLLLTILAAFAEMEHELNSERTKRARRRHAEQGHWLGGPPPYGYRQSIPKRDERGKKLEPTWLLMDPEESAILHMAAAFIVDEGMPVLAAAKRLNKEGLRTRLDADGKPAKNGAGQAMDGGEPAAGTKGCHRTAGLG